MLRSIGPLVAFFFLSAPATGLAQAEIPTKANPTRFGLIEISVSRVRYVATDAWVEEKKGGGKEVVFNMFPPSEYTSFAGVLDERKLNPERIQETVDKAATYYHRLVKDLNIRPGQIYIVASSHFSVIPPEEREFLEKEVVRAIRTKKVPAGLTMEEWEKKPIPFNVMTSRQEYSMICNGVQERDPDRIDSCVVTHIGLGPTHACYYQDNNDKDSQYRGIGYKTPFGGAIQLEEAVRDAILASTPKPANYRPFFPAALTKHVDANIVPQLEKTARGVNGLEGRDIFYLTGDMADALLVLMMPKEILESNDRIKITAETIDDCVKLIMDSKDPNSGSFSLPERPRSAIGESPEQKKINSFYRDVIGDTMSAEQLACGAAILQSLSKKLQLNGKNKEVILLKNTKHIWATELLKQYARTDLNRLVAQKKK